MSGVARVWRVCVTGPESTGKTTLARRLAAWAGTEWCGEAARDYAAARLGELVAADVEPIARAQIDGEDRAREQVAARGGDLLVLDTDLLSTIVYARHYYGRCPAWIERAERRRRADLYLLCNVDVPWVADGVRDRPADRSSMHALFRVALERRRANVVEVSGDWDARFAIAQRSVSSLPVASLAPR